MKSADNSFDKHRGPRIGTFDFSTDCTGQTCLGHFAVGPRCLGAPVAEGGAQSVLCDPLNPHPNEQRFECHVIYHLCRAILGALNAGEHKVGVQAAHLLEDEKCLVGEWHAMQFAGLHPIFWQVSRPCGQSDF